MNTCTLCFCIHNEIVGKRGVTDLQTIYYKYTKYRTFFNNKQQNQIKFTKGTTWTK